MLKKMYIPLTCNTDGSHLRSQTKVDSLVKFATDKELPAIGLCDFNLSQSIAFYKKCKDAGIKPIIGCEFHLKNTLFLAYAKSTQGWVDLLRLYGAVYGSKGEKSCDDILDLLTDNMVYIVIFDISHELRGVLTQFSHVYDGFDPVRGFSKELEFPRALITPNWFLTKKDHHLNNILQSMSFNKPINQCEFASKDNPQYRVLLGEDMEITPGHLVTNEEIVNAIEDFDVLHQPKLPSFGCQDENEYLRQLCRDGFLRLGFSSKNTIYVDRIKHELDIISQAGMAGYFLVVQDLINFGKSKGYLFGIGRGSAGGCLISYLIGITGIDPIKYGLSFERFYSADRVGLPDIDIDLEPDARDIIVEYAKQKYGLDKFAQLATFNTLKGAASIRACMRSSPQGISASEQNDISKILPKEGVIAPELVDQEKNIGSKSLLLWALLNEPDKLARWCEYKNGEYSGIYAEEFQQAVQLDGVIQSRGRHASAFVLCGDPLMKMAPVIYDDHSEEPIIGVDMYSAEDAGLVKIDLLGLDLLTKSKEIHRIVTNECVI